MNRTTQQKLSTIISDLHRLAVAHISVKSRASDIICEVSFVEAPLHSARAHRGRDTLSLNLLVQMSVGTVIISFRSVSRFTDMLLLTV